MKPRRAKIVATVGPASSDPKILHSLLRAGVDVVRLNLSHGTAESHRATIARVRAAAAEAGREIPIMLDLMGPRFRLAELPAGPRTLKRGERLTLGALQGAGAVVDLPVDDPEFLHHLERGERVLIDNGLVELEVEGKRGQRVNARVVFGGTVSTRKGINLPDTALPFSISAKDRADLRLAVEEQADYLAASYVASAADLDALRAAVRALGDDIPLIAKLERAAAVARLDRIEQIVAAADAVMVARGDLGVEVELDRVPVLQKEIVAAGRRAGKPVIVATQMLESMMTQPRPTRAESSDVANAVFDGADALMLSGETAAGRFPVEAVRTMARIIERAESFDDTRADREENHPDHPSLSGAQASGPERNAQAQALAMANVVAAAGAHAANGLPGSRIVAFSQGGFTARRVARHRPTAPVIAFTTDARVARRMQLIWGVRPLLLVGRAERTEELIQLMEADLLERKLVRAGDLLVLLMGAPIRERPLTNMLRVHRVRGRARLRSGVRPQAPR